MMVSFSNGTLSYDDSNKGFMLKWKPRKVYAARKFPERCGRGVVLIDVKAGEISVSENVGMESGATRNLELQKAVLPGGDGISETGLMEVEVVSYVAEDKSFAIGKDMDSGGEGILETGLMEVEIVSSVAEDKSFAMGKDMDSGGEGISETELMEVEVVSSVAGDKSSTTEKDMDSCGEGKLETESCGAGDKSSTTANDMDSGGVNISNVGFDVLLGGDGISETDLIKVETESSGAGYKTESSGAGYKISATVKDVDSGGIKISSVGFDSQSHESGTSHVVENLADLVVAPVEELTESAYFVEESVMETGSLNTQLQHKIDGQTDEATSVPIKAERADAMVGEVTTQVGVFSNDVDELMIEARVTGVCLMNDVSNGSFGGSTKVEGRESILKELNEMDVFASGYELQMETKPVFGGASHLTSSICGYIKPEYSMSDRIKLRRRKVCAVRNSPPSPRMSFSLGKEDYFLEYSNNFDVEREATVSYGSRGRRGKQSVVSSPDNNDNVRPRDNNFSAGKELQGEVVRGLMAAPWKISIDNIANSGGVMKQPKRKRSEGRSKRRAFHDWLDTEGSSGSSSFLKNDHHVTFTEEPADITPTSSFSPDLDKSPGKGCNLKSSLSGFSSVDEEEEALLPGTISTLKKTSIMASGGEETEKNNPFWLNKFKAVARKTICSEKNSGYKAKDDFPAESLFSGKTKDFDVRLPRLGPKNRNCGDARSRVRDILMYFHCICRKILQKEEAFECKSKLSGKKLTRVDLAALNMIKDKGRCVNTKKQILGEVTGVEVGDEFQYRAELAVVGMHRHLQAGIDSMEHEGVPVAISIVTSGSYNDDTEHADVLIYSGQGGNIVGKNKNYEHQKLEKGNLALSNSQKKGTPVRVVRGWTETVKGIDPLDSKSKLVSIYYYDGLYTVKRYWTELGSHGKLVYQFELIRNPGQPELAWKELKKACKSKVREGVCIRDVSHGRESFPICAVNVLDDEKPPEFTYISKMMYPDWSRPSPPMGCDCVARCNDSRKCGCAIRNGGEIPYNRNGAIVESKPYVYECGPHCKCPPTCYNRVTQRGIKVRLEIFKTNSRGWGLRALTSVPSGTFICEYAGELLEDKEAETRIGYDEYLFDIGQNCVDSVANYNDQTVSVENAEEGGYIIDGEEGGYTIDACRYGNLGRFINHSCSPNLYAQNVIYDHDDEKMPHVMLFAMENIPPFKELTYHYNYKLDQITDSDGNVKIKKCFCGSADCSGRLY